MNLGIGIRQHFPMVWEVVWHTAAETRVNTMLIVVIGEAGELALDVCGRPEHRLIQTFSTHRANEPFYEGMRLRHERN